MIGTVYGRLLVLGEHLERSPHRDRQWMCACECGAETIVTTDRLNQGDTRSCGCLARDTTRELGLRFGPQIKHGHNRGHSPTPTYRSWQGMKARCSNPNDPYFHRYGGRGITVCDRWKEFENFLSDVGVRPEGRTLDRIDPDGNYEPGNFRWATPVEQAQNRSAA